MDTYSEAANYDSITFEDTLLVKEEVAPLIRPDGDEISAVRFDALMYGLELAYLAGKNDGRYRSDLLKKVSGIATVANIPEVQNQKSLIQDILNTDYLERAGVGEILMSNRNQKAIDTGAVECDYYDLLAGDRQALEAFPGQYMADYSWAEPTTAHCAQVKASHIYE